MNKLQLRARLGAFGRKASGLALVVASGIASATPTDPFTTAMTDATARVNTYAGALVGLGAVAVLFMIALKYIKKIPRAS